MKQRPMNQTELRAELAQVRASETMHFLALCGAVDGGMPAPIRHAYRGDNGERYTLHLLRPFAADGGIIITVETVKEADGKHSRVCDVEYAEQAYSWARNCSPRDFDSEGAQRRDAVYALITERNTQAARVVAVAGGAS